MTSQRSEPELLASYFTLAGDVNPFRPPVSSPISFHERAEAAARAGFRGFGFSADDLRRLLETLTYDDIGRILRDNGLIHTEIELLRDWFSTGDRRAASDAERAFLIDAAGRLGALHVKIGTSGPPCEFDAIVEIFADLCDRASRVGTGIVMEISPLGLFADLARGAALVTRAGRRNGGLLLDIWHVTRLGIALTDIAALPKGVIGFVELCDGPLAAHGNYAEETVNARRQCGEGQFDIAGFLSSIRAAGYHGPYGVEILSIENRRLSTNDAARQAFSASRSQFTAAI